MIRTPCRIRRTVLTSRPPRALATAERLPRSTSATSRMVHAILLARVPVTAASDLVQDVFVAALERIGELRDVEAFGAWLAQIARHRAIDHLRGHRSHAPLDDGTASRRAARRPRPARLWPPSALSLTTYRETLLMRLVEGLNGPEIAERTGLTPGSVRVNLHRGMQAPARATRHPVPRRNVRCLTICSTGTGDDPIQRSCGSNGCSMAIATEAARRRFGRAGATVIVPGGRHRAGRRGRRRMALASPSRRRRLGRSSRSPERLAAGRTLCRPWGPTIRWRPTRARAPACGWRASAISISSPEPRSGAARPSASSAWRSSMEPSAPRFSAPPRLVIVETASARAVDLGCAYTLSVDAAGGRRLRVTSGWVALETPDGSVYVPAAPRPHCTAAARPARRSSPTPPRASRALDRLDESLARPGRSMSRRSPRCWPRKAARYPVRCSTCAAASGDRARPGARLDARPWAHRCRKTCRARRSSPPTATRSSDGGTHADHRLVMGPPDWRAPRQRLRPKSCPLPPLMRVVRRARMPRRSLVWRRPAFQSYR